MMKRRLIGAAALAAAAIALSTVISWGADFPPTKPAERRTASVAEPWTGFYFGGQVGYGWASSSGCVSPFGAGPFCASGDGAGLAYGGHVGAQKQLGGVVVGVEVEGSILDAVANSGVSGLPPAFPVAAAYDLDLLILARAKLGLPLSDSLMPYLTAGGAFGRGSLTLSTPVGGGFSFTSDEAWSQGWTVGAGVDWKAFQNVVATLDYSYVDLAAADHAFKPAILGGGGFSVPANSKAHVLKARLSILW